jgi:hypothetical protein
VESISWGVIPMPGRGLAIVDEPGLQAAVLLIGVHVGELDEAFSSGRRPGAPFHQIVDILGLQSVLIERVRRFRANS